MSLNSMISSWEPNAAIDRPSLERALGAVANRLPDDYLRFIETSNGGAGFIGPNFINLWRVEEIASSNEDYESSRYAPGLLLFASNGAGEGFGFDLRQTDVKVVMVPFVGLGWADAIVLGDDLTGLFSRLAEDTLYE
ncbi:SMI1/KNR4 family protein [Luteibacter aegosomaticola]|uniref:SMI1/KNR4 family protein n=1 Tax=Luteibacter aegosomaticola TaxID=2911538 RepID=UPI001FF9ACF9|nr:SMI1/KNR4 family protein [Luteibacter aegosomaticola]UPG88325.1 SMI1/KNR4 family protein [Luteibacter aegosomaticola]